VGLPLAVEFGKRMTTIGFDLNKNKLANYREYRDPTGEVSGAELRSAARLSYTGDAPDLVRADFIIVAVPTPVDDAHQPDFSPLHSACELIAPHMKKGAIVIFESTVYPGATEEECIPVLEKGSGMRWMQDFHVGYSPERINPGDKEHTLTNIKKVVSGDDAATLETVAQLYELIVKAGVCRTSSIKAAEAAKVIENTQRDLNIAIIFHKMGIDTLEVLEAAGTKWNFLPFRPGLVGGHCIGVDPYYLTQKAERMGYHPEVILAGRRINDSMGKYIAEQTIKQIIQAGHSVNGSHVIVMGITFKEDCPDSRNTRVIDVVNELKSYGVKVSVHDPVADAEEARHEYGIELHSWESLPTAKAIVAAVAHKPFLGMAMDQYLKKLERGGCFIDVKSRFNARTFTDAGMHVWRL
jgi:UDP-N-acetyl-D-galactosamine dehydrogenase